MNIQEQPLITPPVASSRKFLSPTSIITLFLICFIAIGIIYGWVIASKKHQVASEDKIELSKKVAAQIGAAEFIVPQTDNRSRVVLKGGTGEFVFQKNASTTYTGNIRLSDFAAQSYPYSVIAFISDRQDANSKVYLGLFTDTRNTLVHKDSLELFEVSNTNTSTDTPSYYPHTNDISISGSKNDSTSENTTDAYSDLKSFNGKINLVLPNGSAHTYSFKVSDGSFINVSK